LAAVAVLVALVGLGLTLIEHGLPLGELVAQSQRLKTGVSDTLQVARFRGAYRLAAQAINEGIERAIEKAGGVSRKPADLESILGPTPAQPSMTAFSLPKADDTEQVPAPPPSTPEGMPAAPPAWPSPGSPATPAASPAPSPVKAAPLPTPGTIATNALQTSAPRPPTPLARPAPPPVQSAPKAASGALAGLAAQRPMLPVLPSAPQLSSLDEDEATMVASVPPDVMAQAGAGNENAEWLTVYQEFIRVKRQCGEPTDGLTFEKFALTLRKNRDQLVERHKCKRIRFSVYVKEGRASLKATPTRE